MAEQNQSNYGAEQIQVLEGLEAVRKRPGMYIGTTGPDGLHHLVYEIVDNSIDEALAGYGKQIDVTIHADNSISVLDYGRGIPVELHPKMGLPTVEVVLTVLHAGGKFGGGGYKVSGGLHGVGMSVVNALSTHLEVEIRRNGNVYRQTYCQGKTTSALEIVGSAEDTGTRIHFVPDPAIFTETTVYDFKVLKKRLRELAFLNKGLRISLKDEREGKEQEEVYLQNGGIIDFVQALNEGKDAMNQVIYFEGERDGVQVEIAMQYTDTYTEGTQLHLAGLDIGVLHTPGHTPGSVCLVCENSIFSGDTLFQGSCGRTDLPGGEWDAICKSLKRLAALEGNFWVYPGHGGSTTLRDDKKYNPYMR